MKVEPSDRDWYTIQAIRPGDFVAVHFLPDVTEGLIGFVVSDSGRRLRLSVHQVSGGGIKDEEECLSWDTVIPMTAVAFVRHLPGKPVECACREGLS